MREIKFRAYCKPNGKMHENVYLTVGNMVTTEDDKVVGHCGIDAQLMQYTGLKDKNGVEMYEGDIVSAIAEKEYLKSSAISDIIFGKDFQYVVRYNKCADADFGLPINWGGWESLEIIGNIYEHGYLLK